MRASATTVEKDEECGHLFCNIKTIERMNRKDENDMMWKIFGYDCRGRYRWLCNMEADSFDEVIQKARNYFGYLYVTGAQPL